MTSRIFPAVLLALLVLTTPFHPATADSVKPPPECAAARNAQECADILSKLGKNPFDAFGAVGAEPVYGQNQTPAPPSKNGATTCQPLGILTALLTPLIAVIVGYIAYRQWRTAQNRLKLDLFDRRLAIHSAARDLIATVTSYGRIENKDIFAFLSGIQQARWLLNERIVQYLEKELWPRVTKLQELMDTLDSPDQDRASNLRQQRELKEWIAGQRPSLDSQFDPFLKFPTHL